MLPLDDPRLRFVHRTVLCLLVAGALAAGTAAALHRAEPHALAMSLWVPPVFACILLVLALWLLARPAHLRVIVWVAFVAGLAGLALPAWWTPMLAEATPSGSLIALLPPIASPLVALILGLVVFVPMRQALIAAAVAWVLVAAPILIYLFAHPTELTSPRGMDLMITLGPVALAVLLFVPFHRGIQGRMEQIEAERAKLEVLAERDPLMGLYNRRAGERYLRHMMTGAERGATLVLFDIDHFKRINDTHGHPAGDAVLVEVSRRCAELLHKDDVFARWGGEEFLVLLPGVTGVEAIQRAEALRVAIGNRDIAPVGRVTASFGVTHPRASDTLAELLQRGDEALYAAKAGGRDRVEKC